MDAIRHTFLVRSALGITDGKDGDQSPHDACISAWRLGVPDFAQPRAARGSRGGKACSRGRQVRLQLALGHR